MAAGLVAHLEREVEQRRVAAARHLPGSTQREIADMEFAEAAVRADVLAAVPDVEFVVYGIPAPQGSKSFKGLRAGKALMVESSKKVKPWRAAVKAAAVEVTGSLPGWEVLDGPLVAAMVFTLPKPVSAPKRRRTWPMRYPDVSKLLRATEDAMSGVVWADDARVVEYRRLAKVYPGEGRDALDAPGAVVRVWRMPA